VKRGLPASIGSASTHKLTLCLALLCTALYEIWTQFLTRCENRLWQEAVSNHFTDRLAHAVPAAALDTFYTPFAARCGRIQTIGQLNPDLPETSQSYKSRVVYALGVYAKWEVVYEVVFWADKINTFKCIGDAVPVVMEYEERVAQQKGIAQPSRMEITVKM
jgi:hypothetical protein